MALRILRNKKARKLGLIPANLNKKSDTVFGTKRKVIKPYGIWQKHRTTALYTYNIKCGQWQDIVQESDNNPEKVYTICQSFLNTVVCNAGWARSPRGASQLISHKHILVNGKVMQHKLYRLSPGDVVSLRDEALRHNPHINNAMKKNKAVFGHLKLDGYKCTYEKHADRANIPHTSINFYDACNKSLRA
jgi:ribosomal protein S4